MLPRLLGAVVGLAFAGMAQSATVSEEVVLVCDGTYTDYSGNYDEKLEVKISGAIVRIVLRQNELFVGPGAILEGTYVIDLSLIHI